MKVKVLSVRQPWAWLLVNGIKDVENRTWRTNYRGRLYIHASGKYSNKNHFDWRKAIDWKYGFKLPACDSDLFTGGIIGSVYLKSVSDKSDSKWWEGPGQLAWTVTDPQTMNFVPCKGRLQVWEFDLEGALV